MTAFFDSILTVDTMLNVMVFVFIGLMFWLYFKKGISDDPDDPVG